MSIHVKPEALSFASRVNKDTFLPTLTKWYPFKLHSQISFIQEVVPGHYYSIGNGMKSWKLSHNKSAGTGWRSIEIHSLGALNCKLSLLWRAFHARDEL